ncbi:MAG: MerR family transcriptional regulator [Oscillospiraceae bacterium]|jgi:DNA-binding transcriptional MerR regulator/effector-binding domain-containing protein|nr:MerR family transcriptional regulator [Oscillospiraceae bacterium]
MANNGLIPISRFAKYSRTTRDTLLHYDRIGLLSPILRGENNYRYYSANQLISVNVIRSLQLLGMTLEEIMELRNSTTPKLTAEVIEKQIRKIDSKIDDWIRAKKLLLTIRETINSVANINIDEITIKHLPAEAIIIGDLNDFSGNRVFLDAFLDFYKDMSKKYPEIDLNYQVWMINSEEQIKQGNYYRPDRFYFHNPEGHDKRPAALYAIGYARGEYGQTACLYEKMMKYIDENGYEICGNTYEELPINDSCIADVDNYFIRILMPVKLK